MASLPLFQVRSNSKPILLRYASAVLAAVVVLVLRQMLSPWIGTHYPYLTLSAAVVFSARYCGVGPSVVATLISVLGWYWFLPPARSFTVQDLRTGITGAVVFLVLSGFIIALGEANRRSNARSERSEFRFRRLIESNIIPVICGIKERIIEANDVFLNMTGYSRDDLVAGRLDWTKMTPPEHLPKDTHSLEQLRTQGFCTPFEKEYIRRDGSRVPILIGGIVLNISPLEWLAFVVDLSDLKRVEAELRKSREELEQKVEERPKSLVASLANLEAAIELRRKTEEQLRELSAGLLRVQDEERRHIARELHDSTGQTLTALKMTLASLENLIADVPRASNLLCDLEALADQALQEIRTTSHLLHPPLLDEVEFSSAAQWYVDEFSKRSGIKTSLEVSATPQLTQGAKLVLFRILQESLTNVLRHSGSTAVNVHLRTDDKNALLSVRDYGKGIPSETLRVFHETGAGVGIGLGGMKERVRELGGHLTVDCDGTGTCVIAALPLLKVAALSDQDQERDEAAPAA